MNYEYNKLLKFLYFEGYADSYEEAEYLLEDLNDDEFEELLDVYEARDLSAQTIKIRPGAIAGTEGSVFRGIVGALPDPNSQEEKEKSEKRRKRGKLTFDVREQEDLNLDIGGHRHFVHKVDEVPEGFVPLDDKKTRLVNNFISKGINNLQLNRKKIDVAQHELRNNLPPTYRIGKLVNDTNKTAKLVKNAQSARARSQSPKNNIRKIQREDFILEYLLLNGYVNSYDSAIAIYESMSDEWVNDILEVFKGEGEEYKEFHKKNHRDPNDNARKVNDARGVKKRRGVK